VLRPALIGTRNDLLRLRRGIEQGIIEKRNEERGLARSICPTERKTDRQKERMERMG